jgi:hypothetical protein
MSTRTATIVLSATATIEETWRVQVPADWTDDDLDDMALDLFHAGEFIEDRVVGDESDRDVISATFDSEEV